jgi:L-arabinose isomerase
MSIDDEMQLGTLPFLASSKLLSEGFGYAAEGDVLTAIVVGAMQKLVGGANFTEMFTMDPKGDAILMSHMGESNPSMARDDMPIELIAADFELASTAFRPLLLRFGLAPGEVTLVNLTVTGGGRFKMISTRGSVLDFPPIQGINTPHFKFKPELPLAEFLTKMGVEGSSHHFALAYGDWTPIVSKIADILDIEFSSV